MEQYSIWMPECAKEIPMTTSHQPLCRCWSLLLLAMGLLYGLSAAAAHTIDVTDSAVSYTEDEGAKVVDSSLTLSDGKDIKSATVQITAGYQSGEDQLDTTSLSGLNITAVWAGGSGTLQLTPTSGSTETVANFRSALRKVTYENTNTYDPDTTNRTLTYTVTNEDDDTDTDTATITITSQNDAPTYIGSTPTIAAAIVWPAVDEPRVELTCTIPANAWDDDNTAPGALTGPFYQWQYDSGGSVWNDIPGATASTYTVEDDYYGDTIRCETSVNDGFLTTTQNSDETDAMEDDDTDLLVNAYEDGELVASTTGNDDCDNDGIKDGQEYGFDSGPTPDGVLTPGEFLDFNGLMIV